MGRAKIKKKKEKIQFKIKILFEGTSEFGWFLIGKVKISLMNKERKGEGGKKSVRQKMM